MAIRIITDSTSDIPIENGRELGIDILPLSVLFGDKRYTDGVTLKKDQFYQMLSESAALPTTTQVNPDGFLGLYKKYTDAGDTVISIHISSRLSGTYQSAVIAKEMAKSDRIYLVDSKSATFGLALLVYEAVRLRDDGADAQQIYTHLCSLIGRIRFYAAVDTLKYLKKGGRLSSSAAIIGGMLHIKPLVSVVEGEVKSVGKARGQKAAFAWIRDKLTTDPPDKKYPVFFGHSNAPRLMDDFMKVVSAFVGTVPRYVCEIGCVIGTHAGPGCVGLAYVAE